VDHPEGLLRFLLREPLAAAIDRTGLHAYPTATAAKRLTPSRSCGAQRSRASLEAERTRAVSSAGNGPKRVVSRRRTTSTRSAQPSPPHPHGLRPHGGSRNRTRPDDTGESSRCHASILIERNRFAVGHAADGGLPGNRVRARGGRRRMGSSPGI
jgi:hypothetical protein